METVLIVIHLLLAVALIIVVLMQRTAQEGGGLMGGGGATMGGLFTARGSANLLTRTTAILATAFIGTSLLLGIIAAHQHKSRGLAEQIEQTAPVSPEDKKVTPAESEEPQVPVSK